MSYNIHKLLALAEKFEKATKSLDKKKDKDEDKDKSGPKKRFPFWLKFKKKKVKSSLFDDLLLKYSDSYMNDDVTESLPLNSRSIPPINEDVEDINPDESSKLKMVWDNLSWKPINKHINVLTDSRLNNKIIAIKEEDVWTYWKLINSKLLERNFADLHEIDQQFNIVDLNDQQENKPMSIVPAKGKSIDPKFQKLLGLNPDGILGPVTRSALDNYKKSIGQDGASDELVFIGMKNEPAYQAGKALVYDDNQNVYLSNFLDKKYKTNLPARKNPY